MAANVSKASFFESRMAAHAQLGRITIAQPALVIYVAKSPSLDAANIKTLQKEHVLSGLSQGNFFVMSYCDEHCFQFLKHLNPTYLPPIQTDIEAIRDELHEDRLRDRRAIIRRRGPG